MSVTAKAGLARTFSFSYLVRLSYPSPPQHFHCGSSSNSLLQAIGIRRMPETQHRTEIRCRMIPIVVDQGPGELARIARSRTNSARNSTTASDSTPCLCTARG